MEKGRVAALFRRRSSPVQLPSLVLRPSPGALALDLIRVQFLPAQVHDLPVRVARTGFPPEFAVAVGVIVDASLKIGQDTLHRYSTGCTMVPARFNNGTASESTSAPACYIQFMWQVWVLTVSQFVFVVSLIPAIIDRRQKPPLATSLPTVLGPSATTAAYATLSLWWSAGLAAVLTLCWAILAYQKQRQ